MHSDVCWICMIMLWVPCAKTPILAPKSRGIATNSTRSSRLQPISHLIWRCRAGKTCHFMTHHCNSKSPCFCDAKYFFLSFPVSHCSIGPICAVTLACRITCRASSKSPERLVENLQQEVSRFGTFGQNQCDS